MNKLVIPINDGRLSCNFNHCQYLSLIDIDDDNVVCGHTALPCFAENVVKGLIQLGLTDLLVYSIDYQTLKALELEKVNVFVGVECMELESLIHDFLEGKIISDETIIRKILKEDIAMV